MTNIQKYFFWGIPIIFIVLLAPLSGQIDLAIERYFYVDGHFQSNQYLRFLQSFGIVPGWIVAIGSLVIFILSYIHPFWKPWRPFVLLPLLTVILGAGLIVDKSLKEHWGRPRPRQIEEFGGSQQFRPFYSPNFFHQPEPSKSFPSGHCSMGFLLFSVAFAGWRLGKRWLLLTGMIATVLLGSLLGYTRMALGGHFFSDVIFSAAIMWWTALFSDWLIFQYFLPQRKYREGYKENIFHHRGTEITEE